MLSTEGNSVVLAKYDAKLVAVGCFVERNMEELKEAIPEVDLWVPLKEYSTLQAANFRSFLAFRR